MRKFSVLENGGRIEGHAIPQMSFGAVSRIIRKKDEDNPTSSEKELNAFRTTLLTNYVVAPPLGYK